MKEIYSICEEKLAIDQRSVKREGKEDHGKLLPHPKLMCTLALMVGMMGAISKSLGVILFLILGVIYGCSQKMDC